MPLPAALAARLAKRGLINNSKKTDDGEKGKVHEEVIAEDYDSNARDDYDEIDINQKFMGYKGCPNKYNIYHECSVKCKELWGKGHVQPSEKYIKKYTKLLNKYPLPETWKSVFDPGSGQHYYWDWMSDLVSWLPPGHPKCQVSQPASQLREELHLKEADQDDNMSSDESGSDQESMEVDELENNKNENEKPKDREKYRGPDPKRAVKTVKDNKKDRTLDPMDPASYSDIPRGKWSDGLARQNEAKTGADTTASGTLYQMRPYPSPGSVLRSNKTESDTSK